MSKSEKVSYRCSADEYKKLSDIAAYYGTDSYSEILRALVDREYGIIKRYPKKNGVPKNSCNHPSFASCDICPYENTDECKIGKD